MNRLIIYCDQLDFSSLAKAFDGEFKADCNLSAEILFVEEEEIKNLNAEQRNVDAVTDVLYFPTLEGIKGENIKKSNFIYDVDEERNRFIGSIVICTKRAQEQAEEYGHSYERELFYLATHGLCHLFGYDHMTDQDKAEMREKEKAVMEILYPTKKETSKKSGGNE